MENPSFPPPLDSLRGREFSFLPSIANIPTNLWRLKDANWSEFLVENEDEPVQVWVPRRYLGELSASDRPVMIVGLNRSLEYKAGQVWPLQKRILEMPRPPAGEPAPQATSSPSALDPSLGHQLRLDAAEKKLGRFIFLALGASVLLVAFIVFYFRGRESGEMVEFKTVVQQRLGLEAEDDYFAVVRKLGQPAADRWKAEGESIQYRVLVYPARKLNIVLAGRERGKVLYLGALDDDWKVVDSVNQKGGSNTYHVLARLPRF
ncbi:MAG: hypothetical protein ACK6DX_23545 [Acidobacteriota bacterium]